MIGSSAAVSKALMRSAIQRRAQSTATPAFIKARSQYSVQKAWLSDPSTYPLLACMGGAIALVAGFSTYYITCCPDVRITDSKKHATIRNWDSKLSSTVTPK